MNNLSINWNIPRMRCHGPLEANRRRRPRRGRVAPGFCCELVDYEEAVPAELDHATATAHLHWRDVVRALAEHGFP